MRPKTRSICFYIQKLKSIIGKMAEFSPTNYIIFCPVTANLIWHYCLERLFLSAIMSVINCNIISMIIIVNKNRVTSLLELD